MIISIRSFVPAPWIVEWDVVPPTCAGVPSGTPPPAATPGPGPTTDLRLQPTTPQGSSPGVPKASAAAVSSTTVVPEGVSVTPSRVDSHVSRAVSTFAPTAIDEPRNVGSSPIGALTLMIVCALLAFFAIKKLN